MAKYYGVTRSPEYLAHYGIKGMRWGVRKAIEKGSQRRLDRQWRKANRKLNRLNNKANIEKQFKRGNTAAYLAGYSALGGGIGGALGAVSKETATKLGKWAIPAMGGAGIAGAALASAPFAIAAKRAQKRLETKGHAEALQKAHEWADNMNSAFKGTKYAGKTKRFSDTYVVKTTKYQPNEAKNGNVRPYLIKYEMKTGTDIAKKNEHAAKRLRQDTRDLLFGNRKKKRRG